MSSLPDKNLLTIKGLKTWFYLDEGLIKAVDGIDLMIPRGKTVCLVGESGCGKSITALSVLGMIHPPGKIVSGDVILHIENKDICLTRLKPNSKAIRDIRGGQIAMIFQEPLSSLSPVHTVGNQIMEAIRLHTRSSRKEALEKTLEIMQNTGIPEPERRIRQYPHELSGGLRQRVMIAMALSCRPSLLIADEPTTALDVTIQQQILRLINSIRKELGMSLLLITHDLGVVAETADLVAVMYMGRIAEIAPSDVIFSEPSHPYTIGLMQSIPGCGTARGCGLKVIKGTVPDPFLHLHGCAFHPRCDLAKPGLCDVGNAPELFEIAYQHKTACLVCIDKYKSSGGNNYAV